VRGVRNSGWCVDTRRLSRSELIRRRQSRRSTNVTPRPPLHRRPRSAGRLQLRDDVPAGARNPRPLHLVDHRRSVHPEPRSSAFGSADYPPAGRLTRWKGAPQRADSSHRFPDRRRQAVFMVLAHQRRRLRRGRAGSAVCAPARTATERRPSARLFGAQDRGRELAHSSVCGGSATMRRSRPADAGKIQCPA
jgi:hypothetical protein